MAPHQFFQPQNHNGSKQQTIQPHVVPVVCRHITGHSVKYGKISDADVLCVKMLRQIIGHGKTAQTDF